MTIRKLLLWMVLIDFALFTGWVLWQVGYMGIIQAGLSSPGAMQISVDLIILGSLFCVWMYRDAQARKVNPWPWLVLTALLGSLVPLTYLLIREYRWKNTDLLQGVDPVPNNG